jgi:hypothetical protein
MARCRGWWVWMVVVLWLDAGSVTAQEVLHVYGPGGPAPAMREAAAEFGRTTGIQVEVTAGPTAKWLAKAKSDADIVYSGAEFMMTDLIAAMEGAVDEATVMPLYLRPAAILVRPGNPKRIQDFPDLLKPGMKVLVVQGAGQTGLWEDMAGKQGGHPDRARVAEEHPGGHAEQRRCQGAVGGGPQPRCVAHLEYVATGQSDGGRSRRRFRPVCCLSRLRDCRDQVRHGQAPHGPVHRVCALAARLEDFCQVGLDRSLRLKWR